MKIQYVPKKFSAASLRVIAQAEQICQAYAAQGFDLTLRQLYYQFVSRDLIRNRQTEYKRLGSIINDARLAGLLDWDFIVDRTRNLKSLSTWDRPEDIISASASQFRIDKWADQPTRAEVWIEKDALVGVIEGVCQDNQVSFFSCRGYTSQSEVWGAAQRIGNYLRGGQDVTVIHLGDHDPSGIDMTRDIRDRLMMFTERDGVLSLVEAFQEEIDEQMDLLGVETTADLKEADPEWYDRIIEDMDAISAGWGDLRVNRIALNMDQIEQYNPPPNPTKLSDSRAEGYIEIHGYESWELDALEPTVLATLIQDAIDEVKDEDLWEAAVEAEDGHREGLTLVSDNWDAVTEYARSVG